MAVFFVSMFTILVIPIIVGVIISTQIPNPNLALVIVFILCLVNVLSMLFRIVIYKLKKISITSWVSSIVKSSKKHGRFQTNNDFKTQNSHTRFLLIDWILMFVSCCYITWYILYLSL
jgi:hypothetical protein